MKNGIKDDDWALCPERIPARVIRLAKKCAEDDIVLLADRSHPSKGYCYHCRSWVKAGIERKYKFSVGTDHCPACGTRVFVCFDASDVTWDSTFIANVGTIDRGTDGETIFVRQWHLRRPKPGAAFSEGLLQEVARYAVRGKSSAKWLHEHHGRFFSCHYYDKLDKWVRRPKPAEIYDDYYKMALPDRRVMRAITRGTSLQYMDIRSYVDYVQMRGNDSLVRNEFRYMKNFASKRAYELLWKAGYKAICTNNEGYYAYAGKMTDGVKWQAGTIEGALQLPRWVLKLVDPSLWTCERLYRARGALELYNEGKASPKAVKCMIGEVTLSIRDYRRMLEAAPSLTCDRIISYCKKQERPGMEYRDYLDEAVKLRLDLSSRDVLYPKDLRAAHARTMSLVKYKKNELLEGQFRDAVVKLDPLAFAEGSLSIRPAATVTELIEEGAFLHHCVGGYAERVASGSTAIFFIRTAEAPDIPFFTLEYREGRVIQCRTLHNASYEQNSAVKEFVGHWLSHIKQQRLCA